MIPPLVVVSVAIGLPLAWMFFGLMLFGRRGARFRDPARGMLVAGLGAALSAALLVGIAVSVLLTGCAP